MKEEITPEVLEANLSQFICSENYFTHLLGIKYTDGVQYLADKTNAYWLIDAIASYQREKVVLEDQALQEIQFWTLKKDKEGDGATLTLSRDAGDDVLTQNIEFTDFPLDEIKLYLSNGVLMLPTEY